MDRSLKARLIGASVLVLAVVLVVPELLSGRKTGTAAPAAKAASAHTRTYTIELAGGANRGATDADAAPAPAPVDSPLAADRPARATPPQPPEREAGSAPREAPPAARAKATTAATGAPTAKPPATSAAAPLPPPAAPEHGTWSVQVGAFGSADSARKLVTQLEADGFEAYVSTARRDGKTLHRVRVGPEAGRPQAESLAGRLKARGLPVSVVAND